MANSCICEAKETAKNRLRSCEVQVGHIRLVAMYNENDNASDDFCLNVCNSDYSISSENENRFVHFQYLPFTRLIMCLNFLRGMLRISKLTKLKMDVDFDDEDKHRNISIDYDICDAVFIVHCNGQKLLFDDFVLVDLLREVMRIPAFVNGHRVARKKSAHTDRSIDGVV